MLRPYIIYLSPITQIIEYYRFFDDLLSSYLKHAEAIIALVVKLIGANFGAEDDQKRSHLLTQLPAAEPPAQVRPQSEPQTTAHFESDEPEIVPGEAASGSAEHSPNEPRTASASTKPNSCLAPAKGLPTRIRGTQAEMSLEPTARAANTELRRVDAYAVPRGDDKARRRDMIKDYCDENGELTMSDLARKVGLSLTAIRGIINEDRKRFSIATRDKFLRAINVSVDRWYGR